MQYFYDTNVLLSNDKKWFNQKEKFFISSVTIEELEQIKSSEIKNPEIKYLARKASRWLVDNQDKYYTYLYDSKDKEKTEYDNYYNTMSSSLRKIRCRFPLSLANTSGE